jgi:hypothetical protein
MRCRKNPPDEKSGRDERLRIEKWAAFPNWCVGLQLPVVKSCCLEEYPNNVSDGRTDSASDVTRREFVGGQRLFGRDAKPSFAGVTISISPPHEAGGAWLGLTALSKSPACVSITLPAKS